MSTGLGGSCFHFVAVCFLVGLCLLAPLMSTESRDFTEAFFTPGTFIMFLLNLFPGTQR